MPGRFPVLMTHLDGDALDGLEDASLALSLLLGSGLDLSLLVLSAPRLSPGQTLGLDLLRVQRARLAVNERKQLKKKRNEQGRRRQQRGGRDDDAISNRTATDEQRFERASMRAQSIRQQFQHSKRDSARNAIRCTSGRALDAGPAPAESEPSAR